MKLGPATELDKRNVKFDDNFMFANYDITFIFSMYGWSEAISKPDSGHMVPNSYSFTNSNLLAYKNWKKALKNL